MKAGDKKVQELTLCQLFTQNGSEIVLLNPATAIHTCYIVYSYFMAPQLNEFI